jgi:hypothetical protein
MLVRGNGRGGHCCTCVPSTHQRLNFTGMPGQ